MKTNKSRPAQGKNAAPPQHRLDTSRQQWTRKPQTQIVTNKKAEQRRTMCRKKGIPDGAVLMFKECRSSSGRSRSLRYPSSACR